MPKITPLPAKKMLKILKALGFGLLRVKGSHHFYHHHETGKSTVVPVHSNDDLGVGLLCEIIRDIDISIDEYERLRRKV